MVFGRIAGRDAAQVCHPTIRSTASLTARFRTDFLWGVASAGHQIRGRNTGSDTWFPENVDPDRLPRAVRRGLQQLGAVARGPDLAAGHGAQRLPVLHRVGSDRAVEGEFDAPRWTTTRRWSTAAWSAGLAPVVTFNHFTSPHWFAARGGWLDPEAPELFARFCDRVMARSATGSRSP